jgi:carboxymethylenebutenolidase
MSVLVEHVPYVAAGSPVGGYLARPDGVGPFPAVVVIHEVGGLTGSIRATARRFAAEGYVALAVNLYARRPHALCILRIVVGATVRPLDHGSIHDLRAALTYLAARPEVDAGRLGAIGFCMGGGFAIAWACRDNRLRAIAPFYGTNPRPLDAVARSCPVVGSYPGRDFTAWQGRALARALERHGVPSDIKEYPDTGHSFFDDHGGNYDPEAARDAWQRVLAFFSAHMAP